MRTIKVFSLLIFGTFSVIASCNKASASEVYNNLSLMKAVEIALSNNVEKRISFQAAAIAESQYQEALSARWPTLTLVGSFQRRDKDPTFAFPSSNIPLGGLSGAISAALGGAPVPSNITVPEQNIKLFNRDTTVASLQLLYPLYTGGKISSLISQAGLGNEIAQEEYRRTSLQVIRDVKRYYYAAQLTKSLTDTAHNTVSLLSVTRDLTKNIYEGGSATVNKLDYLKTELAVSYARSIEADFATRHKSALAALSNAMGVPWDSQVNPVDANSVTLGANPEIEVLVKQAKDFNPLIGELKLAVKVANAKIDEAFSGHMPQVAFTADSTHIYNSYHAGLTNDANRTGWTIGIGVSMPLFEGWRTTSQVTTAKLQYAQIQEKQKLVEQGIAALVKNLFIEFDGARQQVSISEQATTIAKENMELTSRAFRIGARKPQDVIEANIYFAIMQCNLFKAQHDQLLNLAEIDYILGTEVE